jgi:hypothetical protein
MLLVGVQAAWTLTCARAELVDIVWTDGGRFERTLPVAAGQFAEVCGALNPGQAVHWSFASDTALDFNIHYHVDKDVRYPARRVQVDRSQGDLAVDSAQTYCWMWTNKSDTAARLVVDLLRK